MPSKSHWIDLLISNLVRSSWRDKFTTWFYKISITHKETNATHETWILTLETYFTYFFHTLVLFFVNLAFIWRWGMLKNPNTILKPNMLRGQECIYGGEYIICTSTKWYLYREKTDNQCTIICFFLKILWFFELCQFCCSAGVLPAWCVYTLTPRDNRERPESRIF